LQQAVQDQVSAQKNLLQHVLRSRAGRPSIESEGEKDETQTETIETSPTVMKRMRGQSARKFDNGLSWSPKRTILPLEVPPKAQTKARIPNKVMDFIHASGPARNIWCFREWIRPASKSAHSYHVETNRVDPRELQEPIPRCT
jgi:hypothetical protein